MILKKLLPHLPPPLILQIVTFYHYIRVNIKKNCQKYRDRSKWCAINIYIYILCYIGFAEFFNLIFDYPDFLPAFDVYF